MRATAKTTPPEPEPSTASLDLREFEKYLVSVGLAGTTLDAYKRSLRYMTEHTGLDPKDWSVKTCRELLVSKWWQGLADSTRVICRAALRRYWSVLEREDLLGPSNRLFFETRPDRSSRSNGLRARSCPPEKVRILVGDLREIIATSDRPEEVFHAMLVHMLAAFGLRCICVSHVRLMDVDLQGMNLFIPNSKGGKDRRIAMDIDIRPQWPRFLEARTAIIKRLVDAAAEGDAPRLSALLEKEALLFFTVRHDARSRAVGSPLTRGTIDSIVRHLTAGRLEQSYNPHSFRHAKVYYLLEERHWPAHLVAKYMGHSSIQTTFSYYDAGPDEMRAAENGHGAPPAPAAVPAGEDIIALLSRDLKDGKITKEVYRSALAALK
jgi:site-specific recombinase XerD